MDKQIKTKLILCFQKQFKKTRLIGNLSFSLLVCYVCTVNPVYQYKIASAECSVSVVLMYLCMMGCNPLTFQSIPFVLRGF